MLILYIFSAHGFAENTFQQQAAHIIFTGVLTWRVAALIPLIWFRPRDAAVRIAAVDDRDARRLYYALLAAALGYVLAQAMLDVLVAAGPPDEVIVTAGFFNNFLFSVIDYTVIFVTMRATARWLASFVNDDGSVSASIKLRLAKYWWVIGILADTIMTIALAYGMLSGNQGVGSSLVTVLTLTVALIFLEFFYDYLQRTSGVVIAAATARDSRDLRLVDLVARCLRFLTRLLIATKVFAIWIFDVLSLVAAEDVPSTRTTIRDIVLTITLSYLVWQIACFYVGRQLGRAATAGAAQGRPPTAGSRLHTMLPLARLVLGITIAVLAILTVLSRLGVNIAPLIASTMPSGLVNTYRAAITAGSSKASACALSNFAIRMVRSSPCLSVCSAPFRI